MSPPGRRRQAVPTFSLLLGLLCLFAGTASAASSVIGLDFGTKFFKAVLVKPGIPFEIVLSKDSKRKEVAALAFKPNPIAVDEGDSYPDRLYGGDAANLAPRFPGEVFPNLKRVMSHMLEDDAYTEEYTQRHPGLSVEAMGPSGLVGFKSHAFSGRDESPFATEELLGMMFKNVRENAVTLAGGASVDDVVMTVPPFYTAEERRTLVSAADLAGLRVNALTTDGLAVGLHYATSRTFPNVDDGKKPEYHMVFDMGAGSTSATVLKFQSRSVKDVGRYNKTVQEVAVVGAGWNTQLGGDIFNGLIVDDMITKFLELPAAKDVNRDDQTRQDFREAARAMERFWRDAERLRQVLSANNDASASFESLYDDIDFKYKLTRKDFEALCAKWSDLIPGTIEGALKTAGLKAGELESVIVHGGATRTPFVQQALEGFFGAAKIRSNVNADEAAAFGAAFKGAGLSPSFRVKDIREYDTVGYPTVLKWAGEGGAPGQEEVFTPYEKLGAIKAISIPQTEEFSFSINQKYDASSEKSIADYETTNVKTQIQALADKSGCSKDDIQFQLNLRLSPVSGIPEVINGTVSCQFEVTEKKGGIVDDVKGLFGFGKKDGQESASDESTASSSTGSESSSTSSSAAPSESAKEEEKLVKKQKTETLEVKLSAKKNMVSSFQGAKDDSLKAAKKRLAAWDASDKQRRQREEALNTLEAYIYRVRDQLEDDGFLAVATDAEKQAISKLRETTSEWMNEAGEKASKKDLVTKYNDLKKLVTPLNKRKEEAAQRPELVESIEGSLKAAGNMLKSVKEQIEKAAESSSTTETPASEETGESASTTVSAGSPAVTPLYTTEDVEELEKVVNTVKEWFSETQAKQDKLKPNEDAVLMAADLKSKARQLDDAVMSLLRKETRRQQQAKASASKSAKSASSKSSSTTTAPDPSDAAGEGPLDFDGLTFDIPKDGKMPTKDEIEEAINRVKAKEGDTQSKHDEL